MFTQIFARDEERRKKRERHRTYAYYAMQLVPSLVFPLSQFRSAFSFKCCLGRNNVVWRAATGRDTCYRCQSLRICRDSSCKLKILFISVPLPLLLLLLLSLRSRGDATVVATRRQHIFPAPLIKLSLSEAHSSPSNFKYTERLSGLLALACLARTSCHSFILPSRSVTSDSNLYLYVGRTRVFLLAMRYSKVLIFRTRFTCANITIPLDLLLKHQRRLRG